MKHGSTTILQRTEQLSKKWVTEAYEEGKYGEIDRESDGHVFRDSRELSTSNIKVKDKWRILCVVISSLET